MDCGNAPLSQLTDSGGIPDAENRISVTLPWIDALAVTWPMGESCRCRPEMAFGGNGLEAAYLATALAARTGSARWPRRNRKPPNSALSLIPEPTAEDPYRPNLGVRLQFGIIPRHHFRRALKGRNDGWMAVLWTR